MALRVIELGRMGYREAYDLQCAHVEEVLAARTAGTPEWGRVLVVEHDPVVTISRRKGAEGNLVAGEAQLAAAGVAVERTDRGGDITYHGPGQMVLYPILDLNVLMLRLHDYMRLLEQVVIDAIGEFGVVGVRDPDATGVWVERTVTGGGGERELAKVAAMGVRVRRWVSMHGLALNVATDLSHYQFIVPCGLAGRPVTSLVELLGECGPTMGEAKAALVRALEKHLREASAQAGAHRGGGAAAVASPRGRRAGGDGDENAVGDDVGGGRC